MSTGNADPLAPFLASTHYLDWRHPQVLERAPALAAGDVVQTASRCFEFVRDSIRHSWDHRLDPVTSRASEVLAARTGFCFAKSHLLAALLRANGIPAGLCYQRLCIDGGVPPHTLHGLNAVYLDGHGWYRCDPRGDTATLHTAFDPPLERLASRPGQPGELDRPGVWREPLPQVVQTLEQQPDHVAVAANLPDIVIFGA